MARVLVLTTARPRRTPQRRPAAGRQPVTRPSSAARAPAGGEAPALRTALPTPLPKPPRPAPGRGRWLLFERERLAVLPRKGHWEAQPLLPLQPAAGSATAAREVAATVTCQASLAPEQGWTETEAC